MARSSKGRQKLEMVKMPNETNRRVTFSKRRSGLFKKASELVSLCAVEIALIIFSPLGKVYTFGHPTLQTIIQKYLSHPSNHPQIPNHHHQRQRLNRDYVGEAQRAILAVDLNHEMKMKENLLERNRRAFEVVGQKIENSPLYRRWSRFSVNELNLTDLFQFKSALENLKMDIDSAKVKKSLDENYNYIPDSDSFFGRNWTAAAAAAAATPTPYVFGFNKTTNDNNILPFDDHQLRDSIFTSSNIIHQNVGESSTAVAAASSFMCPELDLGLGHGYNL